MTKKETHKAAMALVNSCAFSFKVLNEQNGIPQHVRLSNGTDVWPSTGTYQVGKKFYRHDLAGLEVHLFSGGIEKPPKVTALSERVKDLEEYVSHLEYEISQIKSLLSI
jgi:hypothetical protein